MTTQTIIEILNISLPFVSAILLFYLSSHREDFASKKETYKERLNCLYVPFYKIYCRGLMNQIPFSDFSLESRGKVFDLLSNNIQFMDSISQSYYFDFYNSHLNLIDAEDGKDNEKIKIYKSELDAIFKELSKSMFAEYKYLLRKLKLPVPKIQP